MFMKDDSMNKNHEIFGNDASNMPWHQLQRSGMNSLKINQDNKKCVWDAIKRNRRSIKPNLWVNYPTKMIISTLHTPYFISGCRCYPDITDVCQLSR